MLPLLLPPTSFLPPIDKIATFAPSHLLDSVRHLRIIYNPPVRGTRRRKVLDAPIEPQEGCLEWTTSQSACFARLDALRTDSFERAYAIRWLTALITQIGYLEWTELCANDITTLGPDFLVDEAASLLALCCGTSAAGLTTRNFVFFSGQMAVQVEITDLPLDNHDFSSVGAQTWGGACILSELIIENPEKFLQDRFSHSSSRCLRILELGAGTGLVGLTVAKLLYLQPSLCSSDMEIVATDYYPSVLANLRKNIACNLPIDQRPQIITEFLDWSQFPHEDRPVAKLNEPFDVIFGADLIYDHTAPQARWICDCLQKLLRKPSGSDDLGGLFHLLIAHRPGFKNETASILHTFPIVTMKPAGGQHLCVLSLEEIICDIEDADRNAGDDTGSDDQDDHIVRYGHYVIGWK